MAFRHLTGERMGSHKIIQISYNQSIMNNTCHKESIYYMIYGLILSGIFSRYNL